MKAPETGELIPIRILAIDNRLCSRSTRFAALTIWFSDSDARETVVVLSQPRGKN